MGAGVVKPQPDGRGGIRIHINPRNQSSPFGTRPFDSSSNSANRTRPEPEPTACEECAQSFNAFKKKKLCKDCSRYFCSNCVVSIGSSSPRLSQCKKCQILLTGTFSRSLLTNWKVKDLKALLYKKNINISKCREKDDLIELIFIHFGGNPQFNRQTTEQERFVEHLAERMRQEQQSERQSEITTTTTTQAQPGTTQQNQSVQPNSVPETSNTSETNHTVPETSHPDPGQSQRELDQERLRQRQQQEMREVEERLRHELEAEKTASSSQPDNPNLKLCDIKSETQIENLNIKQLKRILINNFVDYKGCVERWELQQRVKRLWVDNENNKKKAEEVRKMTDDPSSVPETSAVNEDDICKICMDAAIDCVLLECGHMVTCTQCGKRLSECPICRQYVVRAVHTFRS